MKNAPLMLGLMSLLACSDAGNTREEPARQSLPSDPAYEKALRLEDAQDTPLRPDTKAIDRLERELRLEPCIGSMDRWQRLYAFSLDLTQGGLDTSKISFRLDEAGIFEFVAGRRTVSPSELFGRIDDRPHRFASGSYWPRTNKLTVESCGNNVGS